MKTIPLPSPQETIRIARAFASALRPGNLVVLSGPMGVGKTFFAKEIAHALGADKRGTASPTFALVHEYRTTKALLLHVDLYRLLESVSFLYQVEMLGIRELRDEGAIALVEWGEKATEALGGEPIARVKLERTGATSRKISVDGEWIEPHLPCARERL